MNHVPVIVWNPAYVEELESDEDVDPADLAPLISGNTPIVTVPASEDEDVAEEVGEDEDVESNPRLRETEPGVKEYDVPASWGHKLSTAYCCP